MHEIGHSSQYGLSMHPSIHIGVAQPGATFRKQSEAAMPHDIYRQPSQ